MKKEIPAKLPAAVADAIVKAGQEGVLRFWDVLPEEGRRRLVHQLEAIDWEGLGELRLKAGEGTAEGVDEEFLAKAASPPSMRLSAGDPTTMARGDATIDLGEETLAAGRVGAILVAGGQGTRLRCEGPKGVFPIGPVSHATLFQLLLGRLVAIRRRYGRDVPLAIMTSSATDADTRRYLEENGYCGLDPSQVLVFRQADLPALAIDTLAMLLDAPDRIAMAPDGHGGMLRALALAGGLEWFENRGIRHVVSFQVDNPLARPLDPEFLGLHVQRRADITTQVVEKQDPAERVGVVAEADGVTRVVEYSDLPDPLARERLPDGRLRLRAGSIAVHCFRLGFLGDAAKSRVALPLHLARKAVPFVDAEGRRVQPSAPNAFKFERFVFDLFPIARVVCTATIDPADGFAPLKNPAGSSSDSPEHVRRALVAHAKKLLARAGVDVAEGIDVELDATSILDEQDIRRVIPGGSRITTVCVIR